ACLERAAEEARDHARVVTLGVRPRWPETGYGYLELEQPLDAIDDPQAPRRVARFREKPDLETARIYVDGGRHLWNAGIFVFRGGVLLDHLRRLVPELAGGLDAIVERPEDAAGLYADLPKISIDYAVMERLDDLATVPLDADWTDLGSWAALADLLEDEADGDGNRGRGDTLTLDARDNLLWADSGTVAVVGVEGLAVVRTDDAVLVMPRERSQDVKALIDALRASGRDTLL
ncbi:MAG: sugar phosphate nucleotidyltransferase, partial [Acidobacteriota bacterium]